MLTHRHSNILKALTLVGVQSLASFHLFCVMAAGGCIQNYSQLWHQSLEDFEGPKAQAKSPAILAKVTRDTHWLRWPLWQGQSIVTKYAPPLTAADNISTFGLIGPKAYMICSSVEAWRRLVTATLKAKAK